MKITSILENMNKNAPQFIFKTSTTFKNEQDMLEGTFSIVNRLNEDVYKVDVVIHKATGDYRITDLDVNDSGRSYEGNTNDYNIVKNYIDHNLSKIIQRLETDD
jgi:hypothetical protein